ncbi:hypothetical protein KCTCHS21_39570 [Cohnella abietis]|uniref:Uncharacterized protein n=1 Tax=Cohnella abietis TaxID=2507935 RepID=A0A3T1D985_9BACL|nr:hypothetical protein KCTCHS21_39570 [Cohnella abietis]
MGGERKFRVTRLRGGRIVKGVRKLLVTDLGEGLYEERCTKISSNATARRHDCREVYEKFE